MNAGWARVALTVLAVPGAIVAGMQTSTGHLTVQSTQRAVPSTDPPRILVLGDHSRSQRYVLFGVPLHVSYPGSPTDSERVAEALATALPTGGELRIASFSDAFLVSPRWVRTHADVRDAFNSVAQPFGASAIWDALYQSAEVLEAVEGRRFIILFSDGRASANAIGFDAALKRVRAANVIVHTVNNNEARFRNQDDQHADPSERLRRLSAATGGQYREVRSDRFPETAHELVRLTAPSDRP